MKKCLIYIEKGYEKYSVDLLSVAEEMYENGFEAIGLTVHGDTAPAVGLFDEVISVQDDRIPEYDTAAIAGIIGELMNEKHFHSILIPATWLGRMLAPRTAMLLSTGLVADVTEIRHKDGRLMMVRPAFSGKIMAGIVNETTEPVMMSVRPGVFTYEGNPGKQTKITVCSPQENRASGIRRVSRVEKPDSRDIRDAEVLVSVGGGAMNALDEAEALAERLGGMRAVSRRPVDAGKADRSIQVGQSGKVVSPKLYIAGGIFGSIQHTAGLNKVKHLIAINTDPKAPICSLADVVVTGDAKTFLGDLINTIDSH